LQSEGWSERAVALAKAERQNGSNYGWQVSLLMFYVYLLNRNLTQGSHTSDKPAMRQRLRDLSRNTSDRDRDAHL
jgi:hypothetical protein